MQKRFALLILLMPHIAFAQVYQKYTVQKNKLSIQLSEGLLSIIPLTDKTIRVEWEKELPKEVREFVLINQAPTCLLYTSRCV